MVEKYIFLVLAFCLILFSYLIYLIIKVKNKTKEKEKEIKNHFDEMVKGIDLNLESESEDNDLIEIEKDLLALQELYEKSMIDLETYQEYALKFSKKIDNKD
jgi:hypothetical protein